MCFKGKIHILFMRRKEFTQFIKREIGQENCFYSSDGHNLHPILFQVQSQHQINLLGH